MFRILNLPGIYADTNGQIKMKNYGVLKSKRSYIFVAHWNSKAVFSAELVAPLRG
jgi:hypothetical protein